MDGKFNGTRASIFAKSAAVKPDPGPNRDPVPAVLAGCPASRWRIKSNAATFTAAGCRFS
jgi:hypothetical protein